MSTRHLDTLLIDFRSGELDATALAHGFRDTAARWPGLPERYSQVPNLDVPQRVAMRESFLFTLDDVHAHPLLSAALTDIAKYLGIPMFSTAGCSDSNEFDEQATFEAGVSILLAALSGANLIHDVGYIESGLNGSLEMLVFCDEAISMVKRMVRGVGVTPETCAVDVIRDVGPGGHYLQHEHTL